MRLKKNNFLKFSLFILAFVNINFCANKNYLHNKKSSANRAYYFSANGNDNNDGSVERPFKSIQKLNSLHLTAGDAVYL